MNKKLCLLMAVILPLGSISCSKIQARMEIRDANEAYAQERYDVALAGYQEARRIDGSFADLDRLIGYSYIGLYTPEDRSPQNEKYADGAIQALKTYLTKRPDDTIARESLINLFLNSNRNSQAIDFFREGLEKNPNDLDSVRSIARLYAQEGNFEEALRWYRRITELDPKNPEAHYTYGVVLYEKVSKNPPPDVALTLDYIEQGKAALIKASELRADYFEAAVFTNLLFREQAKLEADPERQQELLAQADVYRNRAIAINNARKKT